MPTYHRSQRLRLVGTGPKVEQLQEGRFRLTFTCSSTNPSEAWMQGNKSQIFAAYGTLESAEMSIAGIAPRTSEAYSDMVLFRTEANPSERDLIITLIYETATTSFVKSQDDKIDFELNGLQRVTRVTIAKTGTSLPSVTIGTTSITVNGTACKLASRSVEENDAFIQITETYLQQGTVSKSIDNVGSQLAQVITTFGADPAGISGYSIASKEESNFSGYQTNTFRFLKDNVQLSKSVDNQSPLLTEVREYFKPDSSKETLTGYSLISKQESNVDGIPTERYTFGKNGVTLSTSNEKVGSQLAIVKEVFNGTPGTPTDYSIADESISNVGGIATKRFRFLKNNVQLSKSVDNKSPLKTETREYFKPDASKETLANYSLINKSESNVDGIPTERYTFAKDNSIVSVTEDKVGSQNAVVNEIFNPTSESITGVDTDNVALSGYSEADRTESDYAGIKTIRVRFLKENVQLSKSVDNQSPLLTETREYFKPDASKETLANYSLINKQESDVDGIPTERYTFAKDGVEISKSEDNVGSQLAIVRTFFNPASDPTESGYVVAKKDQSDFGGIKTVQYTFLKENVQLSLSVDNDSPLKTEVREYFKPDASKETLANYSLVNKQESNVDGIPTERYTFAKNNVILSTSEDRVGSQLAIVKEVFNGTPGTPTDHVIAKEDVSSVDGIPTKRFTFLKPSILSVSQDFTLDVNQITVQAFSRTEAQVKTALSEVTSDHKLIRQSEQNHDGITTTSYVFEINTSDIINFTADDRLQVTRTIYETFNYDYDGNYTVNSSTATVNSTSVTLTSLRVDQRGTSGTFTKLTAVYTQPKIISASPVARNQYNLTPLYQYRSLSATPKTIDTSAALATPNGGTIGANAVFLEPDVSNTSSPPVITQNVLDTSVDLSVSGSSALISSNQDLYNFLYPGVANLDSRFFGPFFGSPSDSTPRFNRIEIKTKKESHPITTKVRCQVYNFIQRSDQIADTDFTYDGAVGLWSPNSWATVDATIIKNYFGNGQEPSQLSNVYTGYRLNGSSLRGSLTQINNIGDYYNAVVVYNGVNYGYDSRGYFYEIKVTEPGPPDPIGKKWCLGVDIQPAFRDSSNNTYYNKQIIVTEKIPSLQRGQLTYK